MRRARTARGTTLIEVATSSALLIILVGAAISLLQTGTDLHRTSTNVTTSLTQLDRAVTPVTDAVRRGSLASLRKLDGSLFATGETDRGFRIGEVIGYDKGAAVLRPVTIEWDLPAGRTEGEIIRREGPLVTTMASRITDFRVTRADTILQIDLEAAAGPPDDRRRTASTTLLVTPRND